MESIAIIGTGIAAMGCGYFLRGKYDITFYEKNDYPGGHTNTITIDEDGREVFIDTGFMVYNEVTYPLLVRLFRELNVETKPTSMSFSVQHLPSGLEYCGTGINGLFAQRRNIFNFRFIQMLHSLDRFNRESVEVLDEKRYQSYSIEQYVKEKGFHEDLLNRYLMPMSSAVWSTPPELIKSFPVVTLVRFFKNHGFLGLTTHYQWRTLIGGSRCYRDKIFGFFKNRVLLKSPVTKILREHGKAAVYTAAREKTLYDKVIVASHADEALKLLGAPTDLEAGLLKEFRYQKNKATLHTDASLMPKTRRAWSSWNYRIQVDREDRIRPATIYYMNSLQHISKKRDYFISINGAEFIDATKILWEAEYEHPIFTREAVAVQAELPRLNERGPIYFCGSYFRYGFHEDALMSARDAAEAVSGQRIWR